MDRLTAQWGENHAVPTKFDLADFALKLENPEWDGFTKILDRLAAYEEIGLEPDEIKTLIALTVKLLRLCDVPQNDWPKVFCRLHLGAGDYMGTGYAFMDGYRHIYDDFIETTSDGLYQAIKNEIDRQQKEEK